MMVAIAMVAILVMPDFENMIFILCYTLLGFFIIELICKLAVKNLSVMFSAVFQVEV